MKKEKKGVIYILTNPSFPDYIKIGYATDLERRMKQLNRSETVPFAFRAYAVYEVDSELTDKELHRLIDALNPDLRTVETFDGKERVKEFYAMSAEDAYGLLECIAKITRLWTYRSRKKCGNQPEEGRSASARSGFHLAARLSMLMIRASLRQSKMIGISNTRILSLLCQRLRSN